MTSSQPPDTSNQPTNPIDPYTQQWLTVALEEYKSLRTESLTAMANQQATLRLAIGALGVVLGLTVKVEPAARFWIYLLLIPALSLIFFILYAIEFGRMVRVGTYIEKVEGRINKVLCPTEIKPPKNPLGWETWLAKGEQDPNPDPNPAPNLNPDPNQNLNPSPSPKTKVKTKTPPRLRYYEAVPFVFIAVTIFSTLMAWIFGEEQPIHWSIRYYSWIVYLPIPVGIIITVLILYIAYTLTKFRDRYEKFKFFDY